MIEAEVALFRKRRGRNPGKRGHGIPRAGIHALLRIVQDQRPPAPKATRAADALRVCDLQRIRTWLREQRRLDRASIDAFLWEARHFLGWQLERCEAEGLMEVSVSDIDRYMRASKLTRSSLKCAAERLRSLLRYLYRTSLIGTDLSPHVLAPRLYTCERVPSILERDQIAAVLLSASMDKTPAGLWDHAILQLLATYRLRSGEIRNMRIEDIDWRTEAIRVQTSYVVPG
ncbi:integrase [Sinorhizobium sp. BJ1]|uniref:tyrosine-type recombinase/integrase n=1 Tax=Sinorhizobium sp. BJ1 TaxID=2035455 RepID=UPI0015CF38A1|nr:integrase [Sinorhizobium sp. BJ1]